MAEMVLQPPGRAPERLLLYGPQDTGKTTAVAKILARALGPGQTAYVLDTDNSWARVLESGNHPKLVVRAEWEGGAWDDEYTEAGGQGRADAPARLARGAVVPGVRVGRGWPRGLGGLGFRRRTRGNTSRRGTSRRCTARICPSS
jgi:hypothetical protein